MKDLKGHGFNHPWSGFFHGFALTSAPQTGGMAPKIATARLPGIVVPWIALASKRRLPRKQFRKHLRVILPHSNRNPLLAWVAAWFESPPFQYPYETATRQSAKAAVTQLKTASSEPSVELPLPWISDTTPSKNNCRTEKITQWHRAGSFASSFSPMGRFKPFGSSDGTSRWGHC